MKNLFFRNQLKVTKIEFSEFTILFVTIFLLVLFAFLRYPHTVSMVNRELVRRSIVKIIYLEKNFKKEHGRYGSLSDIGFLNPSRDNTVEFSISTKKGLLVKAQESRNLDPFGDKTPGNEYYIGYSNGSIEYNRNN